MRLIITLQVISALVWSVPVLWFARSFVRLFFHRAYSRDCERVTWFFMGLLQVGFALRWLVFHESIPAMRISEVMVWSGLYALSVALALWVMLVAGAHGRGERR
jgi:hypothetical protein